VTEPFDQGFTACSIGRALGLELVSVQKKADPA
jgi:hypothetical protein